MYIIYKSTYVQSALTTLFMEICIYSVELVPKVLNTVLTFFTLKTFRLRKASLKT